MTKVNFLRNVVAIAAVLAAIAMITACSLDFHVIAIKKNR
jgi:hypothetical protein